MPARPITVMGREFSTVSDAIHWVQVGIRLAKSRAEHYRLTRQLIRLKEIERKNK